MDQNQYKKSNLTEKQNKQIEEIEKNIEIEQNLKIEEMKKIFENEKNQKIEQIIQNKKSEESNESEEISINQSSVSSISSISSGEKEEFFIYEEPFLFEKSEDSFDDDSGEEQQQQQQQLEKIGEEIEEKTTNLYENQPKFLIKKSQICDLQIYQNSVFMECEEEDIYIDENIDLKQIQTILDNRDFVELGKYINFCLKYMIDLKIFIDFMQNCDEQDDRYFVEILQELDKYQIRKEFYLEILSETNIYYCGNEYFENIPLLYVNFIGKEYFDFKFGKEKKLLHQILEERFFYYLIFNNYKYESIFSRFKSKSAIYIDINNIEEDFYGTTGEYLKLYNNLKTLKITKIKRFTAAIWIDFPDNIRKLDLSNNDLSNVCSSGEEYGYFDCSPLPAKLREINLSNNDLENLEDFDFKNKIKIIDFQNNRLKSFTKLPDSVENLNLSINQISQCYWKKPPENLKILDLSVNRIENIQQLKLKFSQKLQILDLHYNNIKSIKNWELPNSLQKLFLGRNKITKIEKFKLPSSLVELSLDNNLLQYFNIQNFPKNFTKLDLKDNDFLTNQQKEKIKKNVNGTTIEVLF